MRERPALARLLPSGGAGPGAPAAAEDQAGRLQLFDGIAAVLAACGSPGAPLVLVLEDLHWADSSSRDVLRFLVALFGTETNVGLVRIRFEELLRESEELGWSSQEAAPLRGAAQFEAELAAGLRRDARAGAGGTPPPA